jgi:hypothetical protein
MANKIIHKRSGTPFKKPATTQLELGEIAINFADGTAYILKDDGSTQEVVQLAGTPDAPSTQIGYELTVKDAGSGRTKGEWSPVRTNKILLEEDYALDPGTSASVVGGFQIADGVSLTIPDGSVLVIV